MAEQTPSTGQIIQSPQVDPMEVTHSYVMDELDNLKTGDPKRLYPDANVYSPETIGVLSSLHGTKLNVVAEVATMRGQNTYDLFCVFSAQGSEEGQIAYAVGKLAPSPIDRQMRLETMTSQWLTPGTSTVFGSAGADGMSQDVKLDIEPNGSVLVTSLGQNEAGQSIVLGRYGEEPPEAIKERRMRLLFEPIAADAAIHDKVSDEADFSMLLSPDEMPSPVREEARGDKPKKVTEASETDAVNEVRHELGLQYSILKGVLAQFPDLEKAPLQQVVTALRTDPRVRLAAGKAFLESINRKSKIEGFMPSRLASNSNKGPTGYVSKASNLNSREYTALLVLARLDGTFHKEDIRSTDVRNLELGIDRAGQHGSAADIILGYL